MKTRNRWILAAAVAAMLTGAAPQTQAQTPATPTAPPRAGSTMMRGGMMSSSTPNYSLLVSTHSYDYTDLTFAARRGYSETQIATVAKIAEMTGWSFRDVLAKVARGETFGTIAQDANLKLEDVLEVDDAKQKISDYKAAYESTGMMGMKMMMDKGMMNGK